MNQRDKWKRPETVRAFSCVGERERERVAADKHASARPRLNVKFTLLSPTPTKQNENCQPLIYRALSTQFKIKADNISLNTSPQQVVNIVHNNEGNGRRGDRKSGGTIITECNLRDALHFHEQNTNTNHSIVK